MKLKTAAGEPVEETTNVSEKERSKCTLSQDMINLLIRQLWHELYNHNLYRSFANFFGVRGLVVLEQYYMERAKEEKHHHDWISNYLADCDAEFIYPEVPAVKEKWENNIEPFKLTVKAEIETTTLIHEMVSKAMEECDWATFAWLNGNDDEKGRLVIEQIEEESISRTVLDIASEDAPWLIKEKAIMAAYTGDLD